MRRLTVSISKLPWEIYDSDPQAPEVCGAAFPAKAGQDLCRPSRQWLLGRRQLPGQLT